MYRLLLLLIAANLLCAACVYPVFSIATGAGKLFIVGKYRELDLAGVINADALKKLEAGRFSGDWRNVPDYLGEGAFRYAKVVAAIITVAFAFNSLLLVLMISSVIRSKSLRENKLPN